MHNAKQDQRQHHKEPAGGYCSCQVHVHLNFMPLFCVDGRNIIYFNILMFIGITAIYFLHYHAPYHAKSTLR